MTKKHFIALADTLRELNPDLPHNGPTLTPEELGGKRIQWHETIRALARFCDSQNHRFMAGRWISYIEGACGPNGGQKK